MKDAGNKNRMPTGQRHGSFTHPEKVSRGENHYISKLTDQIVIACIKLHNVDPKQNSFTSLARRFGVSVSVIWEAIEGVTWKHLHTPQVK